MNTVRNHFPRTHQNNIKLTSNETIARCAKAHEKIKMQPAALILITISITCAQLNSIAGFWLTDNTLFQPLASPVQLSGPPIVKQEGETVAGVRSTGDNVEVYSKNDWLRVDPQKNPAQVS